MTTKKQLEAEALRKLSYGNALAIQDVINGRKPGFDFVEEAKSLLAQAEQTSDYTSCPNCYIVLEVGKSNSVTFSVSKVSISDELNGSSTKLLDNKEVVLCQQCGSKIANFLLKE